METTTVVYASVAQTTVSLACSLSTTQRRQSTHPPSHPATQPPSHPTIHPIEHNQRFQLRELREQTFNPNGDSDTLYLYTPSNGAAPLGAFERGILVPRPPAFKLQPSARPPKARGRRLRALHQRTTGEVSGLIISCGAASGGLVVNDFQDGSF